MNEMKKASWGMEEKLSFLEWSKRGMNGVNETPPQRAQSEAASQQLISLFFLCEEEK